MPQFYLRGFSNDGKSIGLYHIGRGLSTASTSIAGQCQDKYFYGEDGDVETMLSQNIEGPAAPVVDRMRREDWVPSIGSDEHLALLMYLCTQLGRTRRAGMAFEDSANSLFQPVAREIAEREGLNLPPNFRAVYETPSVIMLGIAVDLVPILLDMSVVLLVNNTHSEFITSDSPLVEYNLLSSRMDHGTHQGLASVGEMVILPLSPRRTLCLLDKGCYKMGKQLPLVSVETDLDVDQFNILQVLNADRCLYFCPSAGEPQAHHLSRLVRRWKRRKRPVSKVTQEEPPPYLAKKPDTFFRMERSGLDVSLKLACMGVRKKRRRKVQSFRSPPRSLLRWPIRDPDLVRRLEAASQNEFEGQIHPVELGTLISEKLVELVGEHRLEKMWDTPDPKDTSH